MKYLATIFLPVVMIAGVTAEDDLAVLTDQSGKQLEQLLMREFYQHLDRRLESYDALKSRADCEKWQQERRDFFIRQIGGLPERTPLNAEIVGELKGEGYHVEKLKRLLTLLASG